MKLQVITFVLALLLNIASADRLSSGDCVLSLVVNDYNRWHDVVQGFVYALYNNPPPSINECTHCDRIGRNVGAIQMAISDLEATR